MSANKSWVSIMKSTSFEWVLTDVRTTLTWFWTSWTFTFNYLCMSLHFNFSDTCDLVSLPARMITMDNSYNKYGAIINICLRQNTNFLNKYQIINKLYKRMQKWAQNLLFLSYWMNLLCNCKQQNMYEQRVSLFYFNLFYYVL